MVCFIHREKLTLEHFTALTDCCPTQALTVCGEVKSVEGDHGNRFAR